MAKRCSRPISMGFSPRGASRRSPRTAPQPGRRGSSLRREYLRRGWRGPSPVRLPEAIFLMNRGTSIWVGQAPMQGASKQFRQRLASTAAWRGIERRVQIGESLGRSSAVCRELSAVSKSVVPSSSGYEIDVQTTTGPSGRISYGFTRSPYMSGRRSRKNCQVRRTSAIWSKSRSAVTISSLSREPSAMILPRGCRSSFGRKTPRCSRAPRFPTRLIAPTK